MLIVQLKLKKKFLTKMTLESVDENIADVVEKVKKLINEVEPDVNMIKA